MVTSIASIRYLMAEASAEGQELRKMAAFLKTLSTSTLDERRQMAKEPIPVPRVFKMPRNELSLDASMLNDQRLAAAKPILRQVLQDVTVKWFSEQRRLLVSAKKAIEEEDVEELRGKCLHEIIQRIRTNDMLNELGANVPDLLIGQLNMSLAVEEANEEARSEREERLRSYLDKLKREHNLLSRVRPWMQRKERQFLIKDLKDHQFDSHRKALAKCRERDLSLAKYLIERDLTFKRERKEALERELKELTKPAVRRTSRMQIWLPRNYIVTKVDPETRKEERIKTIVQDGKSRDVMVFNDVNLRLETSREVKTTSSYPFWRLKALALDTFCWTLNCIFWLGLFVPFCSPLSLSVIAKIKPFSVGYELDKGTGTLVKRKKTAETIFSMLRGLHR